MKSIYKRILRISAAVFLSACLYFSLAAATETENASEAVLSAIEKKYAGKSFEASFYQISKLAALDITEKASGKASFSHPGKMRWEYLEPEQHGIITNGKSLWIYRPEGNQVMQGEADSFFKTGAGGAFLSDIALVRKNYIITIKDVTDDYTELDLAAKIETPEISLIVIRVSKKNNDIVLVVTRNVYGDTTLFEFNDIQFKSIDPSRFEFTAPKGANVVDLE
ncbi:MAG: hypothetical protein A3J85_02560 [Desulfobacula sp. RIFOXYA12_FULL_46_16]|nr:MAG: hypothetical protein A3J85_02560 [Desulfobacula sp. RIFOXYA12_FULL_46_16]